MRLRQMEKLLLQLFFASVHWQLPVCRFAGDLS